MFFALLLEAALASVAVPEFASRSSRSERWHSVLTHPLLLAHVVLGMAIVLGTIPFVLAAWRSGRVALRGAAALALAAVLAAWAMGERYVGTLQEGFSHAMAAAWLVATVTYAAAWWLGRKYTRTR